MFAQNNKINASDFVLQVRGCNGDNFTLRLHLNTQMRKSSYSVVLKLVSTSENVL